MPEKIITKALIFLVCVCIIWIKNRDVLLHLDESCDGFDRTVK